MFCKDKWLTEQIGKNVYQLKIYDSSKYDFIESWNSFRKEHHLEDYIVFAKVNTNFENIFQCLEDADFKMIDKNIKLEIKGSRLSRIYLLKDIEICFSEKKHQKAIQEIAKGSFLFSRFHIDPKINNNIANKIKENWAKNYFCGARGDEMIVALIKNKPVGFLQLIIKEKELLIDLIGVSQLAQGNGIASSMIKFANNNFNRSYIEVGTQVRNLPSINLYKKLGFKLTSSNYVFHYHSK